MGNVVKEAGSEIALQVMLKATWTFTFSSSLALQMQKKSEIREAEVLRDEGA